MFKRALIYLKRKYNRSILLFLLLFAISLSLSIGLSVWGSIDKVTKEVQQQLGTSFTIKIPQLDSENSDYYEPVSLYNGQIIKSYNGPMLNRDLAKQILQVDGVIDYNGELKEWVCADHIKLISGMSEAIYQSTISRPEQLEYTLELEEKGEIGSFSYTEIRRTDTIIYGNTDSSLYDKFRTGAFDLVEGRHITSEDKQKTLISDELAKQNMDSIEARVLIKYILNKNEINIIANENIELSNENKKQLLESIEKIKKGYPLQYITHYQEFMGIKFEVNENVLIPQPDTEVLVEKTIKIVQKCYPKEDNRNIKILDLCTGSGAIAISLKKYLPSVQVFASDISKKALEIAKTNAKKNDVQIKLIESNMFENINEKFDIVVSNPPYIKTDEITKLSNQVQNEPRLALDGGKDGLDFYRIIQKNIKNYLYENGILLMEIGYDQGQAVASMFKNSKLVKDYAGKNRVIMWESDS